MRFAIASALPLALAAITALAPAALAQNFQTALPVSPAERRAIETRLSTILELSAANQVSQFELPSGRFVEVRPYRMVRRPGAQPCRGYRIDVYGGANASAVDGFRCKRRDGSAWAIVEPEIVLPANVPTDLGARREEFPVANDRPRREGAEPLYPSDEFGEPAVERVVDVNRAIPPIPRPAPRRERQLAALQTTQDGTGEGASAVTAEDLGAVGSAPPASDDTVGEPGVPASGDENPLGAVGSAPRDVTPASPSASGETGGASGDVSSDVFPELSLSEEGERGEEESSAAGNPTTAEPSPEDAGRDEEVVAVIAAVPSESEISQSATAARAVGLDRETVTSGEAPVLTSRAAPGTTLADNVALVGLLRELDYLAEAATPSEDAVKAAIDEFALDERFALPVSEDILTERLTAAVQRSEELPTCQRDSASLCAEES